MLFKVLTLPSIKLKLTYSGQWLIWSRLINVANYVGLIFTSLSCLVYPPGLPSLHSGEERGLISRTAAGIKPTLWGICTIFCTNVQRWGESRLELVRPLITATYSYNEWVWLSSQIEVSGGERGGVTCYLKITDL